MKNYKITYTENGKVKTWTDKSGMGLINTMKYFSSTMNVEIDDIVSTEVLKPKDSLIELLEANQNDSEPVATKTLTKREHELMWLADLEAEQRYCDQNNSFHL